MRIRQLLTIVSVGLLLAAITWAQTAIRLASGQSLPVAASPVSADHLFNGGPAAWNQIAAKHVALVGRVDGDRAYRLLVGVRIGVALFQGGELLGLGAGRQSRNYQTHS
mgnify:CR=1 FL=1